MPNVLDKSNHLIQSVIPLAKCHWTFSLYLYRMQVNNYIATKIGRPYTLETYRPNAEERATSYMLFVVAPGRSCHLFRHLTPYQCSYSVWQACFKRSLTFALWPIIGTPLMSIPPLAPFLLARLLLKIFLMMKAMHSSRSSDITAMRTIAHVGTLHININSNITSIIIIVIVTTNARNHPAYKYIATWPIFKDSRRFAGFHWHCNRELNAPVKFIYRSSIFVNAEISGLMRKEIERQNMPHDTPSLKSLYCTFTWR